MNKELERRLNRIYDLLRLLKCGYHRKQKNGCIVLVEDILDDRIGNIKQELVRIQQALTPPTADEIVKELTPHYKDWYRDFIKIEIDSTGIYAVVEDALDGRSRFIIFKTIDELFETCTCRHLKLEHIDMIASFFMEEK